MTDKALSMIGLATKAGKIASGEFAVESAVRKGKACLVIIASDASDNTKKSFNDMGAYYHLWNKRKSRNTYGTWIQGFTGST